MFAEPTFVASVDGLCGFILEVGDGEVEAFTPSGEWLGAFHDRIEAAEAVIQHAAKSSRRALIIRTNAVVRCPRRADRLTAACRNSAASR